jgi:hypothetical protein
MEVRIGGLAMTALAQAISRLSGVDIDLNTLRAVVTFCSVGLLLSVLLIIWGLTPIAF